MRTDTTQTPSRRQQHTELDRVADGLGDQQPCTLHLGAIYSDHGCNGTEPELLVASAEPFTRDALSDLRRRLQETCSRTRQAITRSHPVPDVPRWDTNCPLTRGQWEQSRQQAAEARAERDAALEVALRDVVADVLEQNGMQPVTLGAATDVAHDGLEWDDDVFYDAVDDEPRSAPAFEHAQQIPVLTYVARYSCRCSHGGHCSTREDGDDPSYGLPTVDLGAGRWLVQLDDDAEPAQMDAAVYNAHQALDAWHDERAELQRVASTDDELLGTMTYDDYQTVISARRTLERQTAPNVSSLLNRELYPSGWNYLCVRDDVPADWR